MYDEGSEFSDENFKMWGNTGPGNTGRKTSLPVQERRMKKYYDLAFETVQTSKNSPESPVTSERMICSAITKQEDSEFGPLFSMVEGMLSPKQIKPVARSSFMKIRKKIVDCNIKRNTKAVINHDKLIGWEEAADMTPNLEIV